MPDNYKVLPKNKTDIRNDTRRLVSHCVECGDEKQVTVQGPELFRFTNMGMFAQNAFPNMSSNDREQFFISGFCGSCWDKMFDF